MTFFVSLTVSAEMTPWRPGKIAKRVVQMW
jgi:hypothetical protein